MSDIEFTLDKFNPFEDRLGEAEEEALDYCVCKGDLISVEIDCGSVYIKCLTCEKNKHESYADYFCAGPMKFTATLDPCSCNFMNQYTCDCDRYLNGVLVTEGESMNADTEGATDG